MIKILYFARFRDTLDCAEENLALPLNTSTVEALVSLLCERGQLWRETLTASQVLVAINQELTDLTASIKDGDEVAFFPPVTGG